MKTARSFSACCLRYGERDAIVTVNGAFPEGTKLNAETKKNDSSYTYDITPVDADGNKVQPDGAAVVMVPLPA